LDFFLTLTPDQPFYWLAGTGRNKVCADSGDCDPIPLGSFGVCANGTAAGMPCTKNDDCGQTGICVGGSQSNAGTSIPPVPDDPFVGELKCVQINADGSPAASDDLIGQATIITSRPGLDPSTDTDAQSYAAVGLRTFARCSGSGAPCARDADCGGGQTCNRTVNTDRALVIGGPVDVAEYQSCPSVLIVDHLFDGAPDPIDGDSVVTDLTLVPCSEDFALGAANLGAATAQFLVFNEFEQRFSTSRRVECFDEVLLSNIDTRNNQKSIFSINVAGTIAGQTRIRAVGDGLLGVARLMKASFPPSSPRPEVIGIGTGYNLHQEGQRTGSGQEDVLMLP